jgi:1-acyl-sn-glycerol-3-phosphate acyltransferase
MILLGRTGFTVPQLFLFTALLNLVVAIYIFSLVPEFLMRFLIWILIHTIYRVEVRGMENIPESGPVIVAANHVTTFDVFPMQLSLPRPIFYMGKAELFKNPIVDIAFRNMGAFPVSRDRKDAWAYNHALKVLAHGQTLGMFPEGTRSRGRGLGVARTGVARMALETDTPIVPMAIIGSDQFFKRFPRRARVTVSLLPPIFPNPNETPLALTDRLMFTLAAALPLEMRGVYAEMPKGFGG